VDLRSHVVKLASFADASVTSLYSSLLCVTVSCRELEDENALCYALFWLPAGSQFKTENMQETNMRMKVAILARYTRVSLTALFTVLD
jgi:hypothetical protein